MKPTTALSLLDAHDSALELELLIRNVPLREYLLDRTLHLAAENLLIKVGESLNQARKEEKELVDGIPSARAVIGMRHFLIHQYREVDEETVWSTAVGEIPQLRAELDYALSTAGYDPLSTE